MDIVKALRNPLLVTDQRFNLTRKAADEIEQLRAVLEWMERKGGLGLDVHERIRAALGRANQ